MTNDIDYAKIIEERRKAEAEKRAATRAEILIKLKEAQIATVSIAYDGYGDEGNVHDVTAFPDSVKLDSDLYFALQNFGMDIAYTTNPGFEDNDGAFGEVTWAVATDTINIEHNSRFTDYKTSNHEDV